MNAVFCGRFDLWMKCLLWSPVKHTCLQAFNSDKNVSVCYHMCREMNAQLARLPEVSVNTLTEV